MAKPNSQKMADDENNAKKHEPQKSMIQPNTVKTLFGCKERVTEKENDIVLTDRTQEKATIGCRR